MRNKNKKIIAFIIMLVSFISILSGVTNVNAASVSLDVPSSVTVGDTITATISGKSEQWNLTLKANGTTIATSSNLTNEGSEITISKTGTYKTTSAGTVTFTLTGDYSYTADGTVKVADVNITKSVTVKEKETPPPTPTPDPTPDPTPEPTPDPTPEPTPDPTPDPTPVTPNFVSASGTRYTTSEVRLRKDWSTTTGAVMVPGGTEVTLTGTSKETVNGYVWYRVSYKGETRYVASSYLTTTKPVEEKPDEQPTTPEVTKSSNTNLKALATNIKGLTPEFSKDVKEYTLTVDADVENIVVTALAEEEKSKVEITGNEGLKVGENLIKVTVTAEDGTTTIYEIKVTKTEKVDLKLSKLEIAGYTLSPEFDPNIFEYTLRVSEIDKLDIEAIANDEKATVEIIGNNELVDGENLLTIIVKSEDGTKTVTYTITVNKGPLQTVQYADDNDMDKIITIAIIALAVLIVLIIIILIVRKTRNQDIEEDEEDTFFEGTEEYQEKINPFIEDSNNDNTYEIKTKNKKGKHF